MPPRPVALCCAALAPAGALPALRDLPALLADGEDLDARIAAARGALADKDGVARALADGRLGLEEAAARFERLDPGPGGRAAARARAASWARALLAGDPRRLAELDARLGREAAGAR
jgi:hypothetical protein